MMQHYKLTASSQRFDRDLCLTQSCIQHLAGAWGVGGRGVCCGLKSPGKAPWRKRIQGWTGCGCGRKLEIISRLAKLPLTRCGCLDVWGTLRLVAAEDLGWGEIDEVIQDRLGPNP